MEGLQQTASGLYVPGGAIQGVSATAEDSLSKHFAGMAKLEAIFPQLVKLALQIAEKLENLTGPKGLRPSMVMFDVPKWHPSGEVYVRIGLDPDGKQTGPSEKAVKNFHTLRQVNDDAPQIVELMMALAFQLVPAVNNGRLDPKSIKVGPPRFMEDGTGFAFNVGMPRPETAI